MVKTLRERSLKLLILSIIGVVGSNFLTSVSYCSDDLILIIKLTKADFFPGDRFTLSILQRNNSTSAIVFNKFIILEVFGSYFFYPTWTEPLDYELTTLAGSTLDVDPILDFDWPEGVGEAEGLCFYLAGTKPGTIPPTIEDLITWDDQQFSYHEYPTPIPSSTVTPVPTTTVTPTPDHFTYSFQIPGTVAELDTGITITQDSLVQVTATGTVCFHNSICDQTTVGPDGFSGQCHEWECTAHPYNPTMDHAALLGRMGASEYFLIGSSYGFIAQTEAVLVLAINDGDVTDNDGWFEGTITIYP